MDLNGSQKSLKIRIVEQLSVLFPYSLKPVVGKLFLKITELQSQLLAKK